MGVERRQYKRYGVTGRTEFQTDSERAVGELLDIGTGGLLIRSRLIPDKGTNLWAQFTVAGYPGGFETRGRVVRTQLDVVAVMFLKPPAGLERPLAWLEHRTSPQPGA